MKCSFNQTLVGTWAGCGFMFFVGLRVGRFLYGGNLHGVPAADYGNLKADALLSCSIGGATACFVGTDVSFVHNVSAPGRGCSTHYRLLMVHRSAGC